MEKTGWIVPWKAGLVVFLLASLLVFGVVLLSKRDPIPSVQVVQVTRTTLDAYISGNGNVEPVDDRVYRAIFESSVSSVLVSEGQAVRKGQTMVTLDADAPSAELTQARIDLLSAREDLRNAQAGGPPDESAQLNGDIQRAQVDVDQLENRHEILEKLVGAHASTQDEWNQNTASLARGRALLDVLKKKQKDLSNRASETEESAELRVRQAEEQIHLLEAKVHSATAIAAVDGTVYSLPIHAGDYVQPGEVLAAMADLHKVRVRAFIDETDLGELKLNQPVKITWDAMPNRTWIGRTQQIPRQVVARGTRSVGEVLCSVDNQDLELIPNVNVDVQILVGESHEALVVPHGAVRMEQSGPMVFVVKGERLQRRAVSLGLASATSNEILSGLNEGDSIALSSNDDLRDGMTINPLHEN